MGKSLIFRKVKEVFTFFLLFAYLELFPKNQRRKQQGSLLPGKKRKQEETVNTTTKTKKSGKDTKLKKFGKFKAIKSGMKNKVGKNVKIKRKSKK